MAQIKKRWTKIRRRWEEILDRTSVRQWLLASLVFLGLFGILALNLLPAGVDVEVGQVSARDIVAPRTVINRPETERLQSEVARRAVVEASEDLANFEINHATVLRAEEMLEGVLQIISEARPSIPAEGEDLVEPEATGPEVSREDVQSALERQWQVELPADTIDLLLEIDSESYLQFEDVARTLINQQIQERIPEGMVDQAREELLAKIEESNLSPALQRAAYQIGSQIIRPNLVLSTQKVEQARRRAVEAVEPVRVLKGEVIIRRGDVVREDHIQILQDLGLHRQRMDYFSLAGLAVVIALILALLAVYLYQHNRDMLLDEGKLALLGVVILVVSFAAKILFMIEWNPAAFLTPVALSGFLLGILLDSRVALISVVTLSLVIALVSDLDMVVTLIALTSGFAGVFSVSKVSQRADLMRAGFVVGGTTFLFMLALGLVRREIDLVIHSYLGVLNGLFSSIAAIGTLPFLESIFGITSSIRLLELSNPNNPLLRRLLMEAPGTYHHSILVGNLAEAAAEAVGADGLLARVGSTYHDVGKLKRSYFFVENQVGSENPHDKISPTLSTLIITSHVKDGLEIAKEYKLPDVINDFIAQHHGSDLVKFFYHRAKERGSECILEKDFRYQGPKPQTKETAIVSLADATEAAVRSLSKPTPGKIEALVRKIIKDRLSDGQLDESDLTFKDLDRIADAFVRVLTGIFHARVEYPEITSKDDLRRSEGKNRNGDSSNKSTGAD